MAEFTGQQRRDAYKTEISVKINDSTTSITVEDAPGFTLGAGEYVYGAIEPLSSNREGIKVTGISGSVLTVERGLPVVEGGASTAAEHAGGKTLVLSDNWQTFDDITTAIATKADSDLSNVPDSFHLSTASGVEIEDNAGELEFTSSTTATKTLAQLSALSGSDEKVKVSIADTTEEYLDDALTAGTGITATITNPAANETLTIAADLASQVEAETGTDNTVLMTPLRTEQAMENQYAAIGDLQAGTGAKTRTALSVGTDGQVLTADSGEASGMKWDTPLYEGVGISGVKSFYTFTLPWLFTTNIPSGDFWTTSNCVIGVRTSNIGRLEASSDSNWYTTTSHFLFPKDTDPHVGAEFATTKKVIVEADVAFRAKGAVKTGGVGLINSGAPLYSALSYNTTDALMFFIDTDGTLYASSIDGGTGRTNTALSAITNVEINTVRIEFDPGVDAKFYLNGALEATITTNLVTIRWLGLSLQQLRR